MNSLKTPLLIAVLFIAKFIYATGDGESTSEANWGTHPTEAKGYWLRLGQLANQKDYATAYQPCSWLLQNAPDLNADLYTIAAKVYRTKLRSEKDASLKQGLKDTIIMIYDKHINEFDGGARVMNKKGKVAWLYQGRSTANHDNLFKLYTDIYAQNGKKTYNANMYFHFVTATRQYRKKNMTEAELLSLYDQLITDMEERGAVAENSKKADILKYTEKIDDELNKFIQVDCEFVMNNYGSKFKAAPSVELAHKIQSKLAKNNCVDNDLYVNTTNFLIEKEGPTYANVKTLGNIYLSQGKNEMAYSKYAQAIELSEDAEAKGALYMKLAKMDRKEGKLAAARTDILKAIEADPKLSTVGHNTIAAMYLSSFNSLATGDPVEDRLVYIAAYEEYKLASNTTKMAETKEQFPSMEDIFVRNLTVGTAMTVKSWINRTVKLEKRN